MATTTNSTPADVARFENELFNSGVCGAIEEARHLIDFAQDELLNASRGLPDGGWNHELDRGYAAVKAVQRILVELDEDIEEEVDASIAKHDAERAAREAA